MAGTSRSPRPTSPEPPSSPAPSLIPDSGAIRPTEPEHTVQAATLPAMSEPTTQPAIRMELGGIEDFPTAIAMLRATGARRLQEGRNNRVFVIDHDISAQQTAALIQFLVYGRRERFLKVTLNAPEPDDLGIAEWWETA